MAEQFQVTFVLDANDTGLQEALNRNAAASAKLEAAVGKLGDTGRRGGEGMQQTARGARAATNEIQPLTNAVQALRTVVAGYLGLQLVTEIGRQADAYANMTAQLRVAVGETGNFGRAQRDVFAIAQGTSTQLGTVSALYTRLSTSLRDVGISQREVGLLTERISQAFAVSGAGAAESAGAIRQLTQAFAAGALRGEEFNSVNEQGQRIMQALANSLGVTRGELKKMAEEGQLTADRLRTALLSIEGDKIAAEFAQLPITIGRAWTQVQNSFTRFVGQTDQAISASRAIAGVLQLVADNFGVVAAVAGTAAAIYGGSLLLSLRAATSAWLAKQAAMLSSAAAMQASNAAMGATVSVAGASAIALGGLATAARALSVALGPIAIAVTVATWLYSLRDASDETAEAVQQYADAINAAAAATYDSQPAKIAAIAAAREEAAAAMRNAEAALALAQAKGVNLGIGYGFFSPEDRAAAAEAQDALVRLRQLVRETDEEFGQAAVNGVQAFVRSLLQMKSVADLANYDDVVEGLQKANTQLEAQRIGLDQGAQAAMRYKVATELGVDVNADLGEELEAMLATFGRTSSAVDALTSRQREGAKATKDAAKAAADWRKEMEGLASAVLADDKAEQLMRLAMAMEEAARAGQPGLVAQLSRAYDRLADSIEKTKLEASATKNAYDALLDPVQELLAGYTDEARLIGLTATARARATAVMQAEREARRAIDEAAQKGIVYTRQEREQIIATARARADALVTMEEAAERAQAAQQRVADVFYSIGDAVGDVVRGSIRSFGDFFDSIVDSARNAVADMIAEFVRLQVIGPMLQGIFGGFSFTGGGGGGGASAYAGAVMQSATSSVVQAGIGQVLTGGSAAASAGTSSGNSWGSAFTAAAGDYLAGFSATMAGFGSGFAAGASGTAWTTGQLSSGFVGPVAPGYTTGAYAGTVAPWLAAAGGAAYGLTNRGQRTGDAGSIAAGASYGALGMAAVGTAAGVAGGAGAAAAAGGAFSAIGAAAWVPVVGWILAILALVDMVGGGKLFGTRYRPDQYETTVGVGEDGGTARLQVREERQRALFGGRAARYRDLDIPDPLQDQADAFYRGIVQMHRSSAIALGRAATEIAPIIEGAYTQVFEARGEQQLKTEFGEMLGRVFEEPFEEFAQRLAGANLLSSIAMSLSADQISDDRWAGYGREGSSGGGGSPGPDTPTNIKSYLEGVAASIDAGAGAIAGSSAAAKVAADAAAQGWDESFSALMSIAVRWDSTGEQFLQGAQFLMAAAVDVVDGFGLLGEGGTLEQIADLTEEYQAANESLIDTYARLRASVQLFEFAVDLAGTSIEGTREEFVRLAADIVEAAGGLERANSLWTRFFEGFYSQTEILGQQLSQATERRDQMAADLGIDPDMALEEFRELFEDKMPTLTAAQIVEWLELADAMLTVEEITDRVGESMGNARRTGSAYYEAVYEIVRATNEAAEAAREHGASEGELALIHLNAARRIAQATAILEAQTRDLISQLYGGLPGTVDEADRQIQVLEQRMREAGQQGANSVGDSLRNVFEQWRRGLEAVRGWLDDILLNQQLTTLTPQQQLAEAQLQFDALVARARGGDAEAVGQLPGAANTLLGLARGYWSSGDQYQAIFDQVMQAMQGVGGMPLPQQPGGQGNTTTVVPSPELVALYEHRDALLAEQTGAYRAQLALDLAAHIRDLAGAIGMPVFQLLDTMGVNLEALATDMGVNLDNLTGSSVEALATMASLLGISLGELTTALGLELTDLSGGVTELAESIGIDLSNMTVESTRSLAALAASLGVDLSDLTTSLGIDLGDLADSQSLLNQALESEINGLPARQRDELRELFNAVATATNEADANAAIGLLEDAVEDLSPDLQDRLAPYLQGIVPTSQSADVRELIAANTWLESLDDQLYDQLQVLKAIRDALVGDGPTAQAAQGIPAYQTGAKLITQSGLANLHANEGVVDPTAWTYLRTYGIDVNAGSGGPYDAAMLAEQTATRRTIDEGLAVLDEHLTELRDEVAVLERRVGDLAALKRRQMDNQTR